METYEQIKEEHLYCTTTPRQAFCSCGSVRYEWGAREASHEAHVIAMFEQALRAQIADDISSASMTLISGSPAEAARSAQRQAARIARKG